jgi:hypothetical protein
MSTTRATVPTSRLSATTIGAYSHVLPSMQKEATARLDRLFAKNLK